MSIELSTCVNTCSIDSHGQLGHGGLLSEEEPRIVEALWGMPMSSVAAGGWHSVCISGKKKKKKIQHPGCKEQHERFEWEIKCMQ